MSESENIRQELLKQAPLLANLPSTMPFEVPSGYFDTVADSALDSLHAHNSPVPDGYFDRFPEKMLDIIRSIEAEEELKKIAPGLIGLNKTMPYAVPDGYFEKMDLPVRKPAPIIALAVKKWMRVAAAVLLFATGGWQWYLQVNKPGNAAQLVKTNEPIPSDTLAHDLSVSLMELEDPELEEAHALESGPDAAYDHAAALLIFDDQLEKALESVDDDAIANELKQIPSTTKTI